MDYHVAFLDGNICGVVADVRYLEFVDARGNLEGELTVDVRSDWIALGRFFRSSDEWLFGVRVKDSAPDRTRLG